MLMKKPQKYFLLATVMGMGLFFSSMNKADAAPHIKLIEAGWERPDSADLLANLKEIEQTPYSGIVIMIKGKDDDEKTVVMQNTFTARPWKRQWFAQNIKELQAAKSPQLTDNFVRIGANPGDIDWFDDVGWKQIVDHWKIIAWVAKQGGLKGILFDPEPYAKPLFQMNYAAQTQHANHTFEEYEAKVRERGREVMNAIKSEYPDMTIFSFFMNSVNMASAAKADPQKALQTAGYNLYPAFINGWLDEAPPSVTFVDGCEGPGYHANGELDYLRPANGMRNTVLSLVAPENRFKYKAQLQVGVSFYLDAYVNPETSKYYIPPTDGSRVTTFKNNLDFASKVTDQYIWTWGEKYRWYPTENKGVNPQYWEEMLPGITDVLRSAVNPDYWVQQAQAKFDAMEKSGKLVNLVTNGDFASDASASKDTKVAADWKSKGAPPGWSIWQKTIDGKQPGIFKWDTAVDHTSKRGSGSAYMSNMQQSGTYIQDIPVKAGEIYKLLAWQQFAQADGHGSISARWQDAKGKWLPVSNDVTIFNSDKTKAGEWQQLSGFVKVPQNAAKLVLLLGASSQSSPKDAVWYDDVELYKVG